MKYSGATTQLSYIFDVELSPNSQTVYFLIHIGAMIPNDTDPPIVAVIQCLSSLSPQTFHGIPLNHCWFFCSFPEDEKKCLPRLEFTNSSSGSDEKIWTLLHILTSLFLRLLISHCDWTERTFLQTLLSRRSSLLHLQLCPFALPTTPFATDHCLSRYRLIIVIMAGPSSRIRASMEDPRAHFPSFSSTVLTATNKMARWPCPSFYEVVCAENNYKSMVFGEWKRIEQHDAPPVFVFEYCTLTRLPRSKWNPLLLVVCHCC